MDKRHVLFLLIGLFCLPFLTFGQERYAVHYKYKSTVEFNLEEPESFLTQRAIERRLKEGVELDSTDLPVSREYIEEVTAKTELVHYHSNWLNASVVVATAEQVEEISQLPFVDHVELVGKGFHSSDHHGKKELSEAPAGSLTSSEMERSYEFQNDMLGIPAMHKAGYTGKGIMIALLDAGFLNVDKIAGMKHLFEENKIVATKDFVLPGSDDVFRTDGHGTASLSLVAAYEESKLIGGAYDSQFILCITEDVESEYRIEEYNWVRAAEFSDSLGVDIINSSLGYNHFDDPEMNYDTGDMDGSTAVISRGASLAARKGILVVSSVGNEGNDSWGTVTAPADAEGILSIGAVNSMLARSSFSSIGPTADGRIKPELAAFGSGVTIWRRGDNTSFSSGTSFSSPQIAALAAGLWQAKPDWTKDELIENLLNSGNIADSPDNELGYGIPNFMDAYLGEVLDVEEENESVLSVIYPNPLDGDELFIEYGRGKNCNIRMFTTSGILVREMDLDRISHRYPYQMTLANTPPGLYFLECKENGTPKVFRLVKK